MPKSQSARWLNAFMIAWMNRSPLIKLSIKEHMNEGTTAITDFCLFVCFFEVPKWHTVCLHLSDDVKWWRTTTASSVINYLTVTTTAIYHHQTLWYWQQWQWSKWIKKNEIKYTLIYLTHVQHKFVTASTTSATQSIVRSTISFLSFFCACVRM